MVSRWARRSSGGASSEAVGVTTTSMGCRLRRVQRSPPVQCGNNPVAAHWEECSDVLDFGRKRVSGQVKIVYIV